MLIQEPIEAYVREAASGSETPGGGSVSALCGALASCMASMAAEFTAGKPKYADVEDEIRQTLATLESQRAILMKSVDGDAGAFDKITAVYGMPKSTDAEKAARDAAMQEALQGGMAVPLDVMRACVAALACLPRLAEVGNKNLITDTGVAAILLDAACRAARLNVAINLKWMKDASLVETTRKEVDDLLVRSDRLAQETLLLVEQAL